MDNTDYMSMAIATIVAIAPVAALIGGVIIAALAILGRGRLETQAHLERLAMIERGLTPPADERAFPGGLPFGSWNDMRATQREKDDPTRRRDNAVWFVGFGSAAALLFWVGFGDPDLGVGIGGAFWILGLTYFVSASCIPPRVGHRPSPGPVGTTRPRPPDVHPPQRSAGLVSRSVYR